MEREIDIKEIGNMALAVTHYYGLGSYFPDLKRNNKFSDNLIEFLKSKNADSNYWESQVARNWNRIDLHLVDQMWGSTSCGWGGIGGAAMSNKFNMIVENKYLGIFLVYWDGQLAYIAEMTDNVKYSSLPSITNCEKVLKILYTSR